MSIYTGINNAMQAAMGAANNAAQGTQTPYNQQQIQSYLQSQYGLAPGSTSGLNDTTARAIYADAQRFGVGADQIDSALGLQAGTSANWIQSQGFNPLGAMPSAQSIVQPPPALSAPPAQAAAPAPAPPVAPSPVAPPAAVAPPTTQPAAVTAAPPPVATNAAAPAQADSQYGYGQAPNSSNRGYYEQRTPVGSFAAADQQRARGYTAMANMALNPYIGMTSAGISGQPSVMSYAERAAANSLRENPYLGMTTGTASAAQNSMAGLNNPYLTQAIDAASSDAARNYNLAIAPQRDRQMQQSGSFGNTGIQQMALEDQRNFGQTLGNIANSARMADYNQQFGAAENLANRQTGVSQFNSGLNAGDIGRNLGGYFTGQGLGLQGTSQLLDAAKFDANMGNSVNMFNSTLGSNDLNRNANLAQGMGQFNAGQGNAVNMFNAGALNTNSMFNAGQGNNMNLANAGAANSMLAQYRNLSEQGRQFDETLDQNIYRGNVADARNANRDYIDFLNALTGMNSGAYNMAGNAYQLPWQYLMGAGGLGANIGGMGGTTSQNMSGNPYMGLIGGYMLGNQIFNPRGG